jgi:hypothetical protein
MNGSIYILGWMGLYEIFFKHNWQWAVQYIFRGGWDSRKYSYRPYHPRIYVEPFIVNCVWRIFPTDPSTPEYILNHSFWQNMVLHIFWDGRVCMKYSLNTIDNERFNIYSGMNGSNCVWIIFPTDPPQNICWTIHCQLCLKNISYRPIHPRIYVEPFFVN